MHNGFWKYTNGHDQYTRNCRPKEISVSFMYSGSSAFKDPVKVTLKDDKKRNDWMKISLGRHNNVTAIRITINSVYKGSKFKKDVAISDIMVVVEPEAEERTRSGASYETLKKGNKSDAVYQMKLRL